MTEKRFYLDENGINDSEYEFSVLGEDELVNIINELNDENKELKQINHSVFKSIGNRIKFWKELAETNRSNSVLQRVVEDLEDLYKLKKVI